MRRTMIRRTVKREWLAFVNDRMAWVVIALFVVIILLWGLVVADLTPRP